MAELLRVAVHSSFFPDPEADVCHATHKAIQHADETLRLHTLYFMHVVAAICAGLVPLAVHSSVSSARVAQRRKQGLFF